MSAPKEAPNARPLPDPNAFSSLEDFKTGTILLVDKPLGWTSFDVVNKVRWLIRHRLGVRKIKVGHAGTLDPLATGLLVLCTGKLTPLITSLIDDDKGYTGDLRFGTTTPSYDLETAPDATFSTEEIPEATIRAAARTFTPGYSQTAPLFSAKKVDGKPAYRAARKGKTVEIPPRDVAIHRFELTAMQWPDAEFDVLCSKGTYIRSLVHDLGKALNNGAHLTALRRYRSGRFAVDDAITIEEFERRLNALPSLETPE